MFGFGVFDVIGALAVTSWIVFMFLLMQRDRVPVGENTLELTPEDIAAGFREGEEWHGLYHQSRKIGFVQIARSRLEDGFRVEYNGIMELVAMGQSHRLEIEIDTEVDEGFVLQRFSGSMVTELTAMDMTGRTIRADDGSYRIHYSLTTAGVTQTGEVDLASAPMLDFDVRRAVLTQDPAAGDTYEHEYFDPLSQQPRSVVIEYLGREPLLVMGREVQAHHLVQHMAGQALGVWVNDVGEVLREELPLGLVGKRESRAEAMYGVLRETEQAAREPMVDLVNEVAIHLQGVPPDLESVARMTWRLGGVQSSGFDLDGSRQDLTDHQNGLHLLIVREPTDRTYSIGDLPVPSDLVRQRQPAPFVQSDAEPIVALAREIRSDEDNVVAVAERVSQWVFDNLSKESVVGIPNALEALQNERGDCNEHATLATALLRATGIPARVASGIAYLEGRFYYHAWVEYWHDGWRTADPTWGQFPADLGHIRFVAGGLERQTALMSLMGRLTVEIVE